jgi:hypothetical protein
VPCQFPCSLVSQVFGSKSYTVSAGPTHRQRLNISPQLDVELSTAGYQAVPGKDNQTPLLVHNNIQHDNEGPNASPCSQPMKDTNLITLRVKHSS